MLSSLSQNIKSEIKSPDPLATNVRTGVGNVEESPFFELKENDEKEISSAMKKKGDDIEKSLNKGYQSNYSIDNKFDSKKENDEEANIVFGNLNYAEDLIRQMLRLKQLVIKKLKEVHFKKNYENKDDKKGEKKDDRKYYDKGDDKKNYDQQFYNQRGGYSSGYSNSYLSSYSKSQLSERIKKKEKELDNLKRNKRSYSSFSSSYNGYEDYDIANLEEELRRLKKEYNETYANSSLYFSETKKREELEKKNNYHQEVKSIDYDAYYKKNNLEKLRFIRELIDINGRKMLSLKNDIQNIENGIVDILRIQGKNYMNEVENLKKQSERYLQTMKALLNQARDLFDEWTLQEKKEDKGDEYNLKSWERSLERLERELIERETEIKEKQKCFKPLEKIESSLLPVFKASVIDQINIKLDNFNSSLDMQETSMIRDFLRLSNGFLEQFNYQKEQSKKENEEFINKRKVPFPNNEENAEIDDGVLEKDWDDDSRFVHEKNRQNKIIDAKLNEQRKRKNFLDTIDKPFVPRDNLRPDQELVDLVDENRTQKGGGILNTTSRFIRGYGKYWKFTDNLNQNLTKIKDFYDILIEDTKNKNDEIKKKLILMKDKLDDILQNISKILTIEASLKRFTTKNTEQELKKVLAELFNTNILLNNIDPQQLNNNNDFLQFINSFGFKNNEYVVYNDTLFSDIIEGKNKEFPDKIDKIVSLYEEKKAESQKKQKEEKHERQEERQEERQNQREEKSEKENQRQEKERSQKDNIKKREEKGRNENEENQEKLISTNYIPESDPKRYKNFFENEKVKKLYDQYDPDKYKKYNSKNDNEIEKDLKKKDDESYEKEVLRRSHDPLVLKYDFRREKVFRELYNEINELARKLIKQYRQKHFDLMTKILHKKLKYINNWKTNPELKRFLKPYGEILERLNKRFEKLAVRADKFILKDFIQIYNKQIEAFDLREIVDTEERVEFLDKSNRVRNDLDYYNTEIHDFYLKSIKVVDIFFDYQFIAMYIIKIISFILFYFTIRETEKRFSYDYTVRADIYQSPIRLINYPLYAFGIHFALNIAFFMVLLGLYYLYKRSTNTFFVDKYLLRAFVVDYLIIALFTLTLSLLISLIIEKKEYFRYNTEGTRAIRVQSQFMIILMAIFLMGPFFYYF